MGFLNKKQEDDDELPGSSGLHVDLELRVCPECRREALPWQDACPDCGVTPVPRTELASSSFALPAHLLEGLEDDAPEGDADRQQDDDT